MSKRIKTSQAIKDLKARVDGEFYIQGKDDCADMKLGIEALRRIESIRSYPDNTPGRLLRGEKPE